MFDPAEYLDGSTDIRLRVECLLHLRDDEYPIRLVIVDGDDNELTELKFTPSRAIESAMPMARLLAGFIPRTDTHKLAEGLRIAAIKVWATRN
jgi:hypothetical protein